MKFRNTMLAAVALLLLPLAACGDDDDDNGAEPTADATGEEGTDEAGGENPTIREGVTAVEVTATEYEFEFDSGEIEDGNLAFVLNNEGEEGHEIVIARVSDDFDVETAFAGEAAGGEELPPGVEEVAGFVPAAPGESATLDFAAELLAGRYYMMCFVEREDGEFHIDLGMYSEFEVPE